MLATLLRLAESRSIPARADDELLLHMQQMFAQGYSGLNVRSCRLASRSISIRRPDSSGLPQIIGRQNPARQQRVVRHRLQPRLALRRSARFAGLSFGKHPADGTGSGRGFARVTVAGMTIGGARNRRHFHARQYRPGGDVTIRFQLHRLL